jgi:hypothetical protein
MRRARSAVLVISAVAGCSTWSATEIPLAELTAPPKTPPTVRVTTSTGQRVQFDAPRVSGDSLVDLATHSDTAQRVVALSAITNVERKKTSTALTIGVVVATVAVVLGVGFLATFSW